ncbi:MAG: hypothetical protein AB1813_28410 [Verrucomicrobiota bacterium]
MSAELKVNEIEVVNRLADLLGVTKEQIIEVVYAGAAGRAECTSHHPSSMAGMRCWGDATRALRDLLVPLGWRIDNTDNIPSVVHPGTNIKVAVCNSDSDTGYQYGHPQPIREKGDGTKRAVFPNQDVMVQILAEGLNQNQPITKSSFWYLCIHCGKDVDGNDTVRAELLCPVLDEEGLFKDFQERIAIIGPNDNSSAVPVEQQSPEGPDSDSGFEINVTRKQA